MDLKKTNYFDLRKMAARKRWTVQETGQGLIAMTGYAYLGDEEKTALFSSADLDARIRQASAEKPRETELYLRLSNWLVIRRRETLQLKSHAMQVLQLIWRGLFVDMAQQVIAASELKDERLLYVAISTQGDGDPPDDALGFVDFLSGKRAPQLPQLKYAVLALGDSSYPQFCAIGQRIDARLAELGAARVADVANADLDVETVATPWAASAVGIAQELLKPSAPLATVVPLRDADPLGVEWTVCSAPSWSSRTTPPCVLRWPHSCVPVAISSRSSATGKLPLRCCPA